MQVHLTAPDQASGQQTQSTFHASNMYCIPNSINGSIFKVKHWNNGGWKHTLSINVHVSHSAYSVQWSHKCLHRAYICGEKLSSELILKCSESIQNHWREKCDASENQYILPTLIYIVQWQSYISLNSSHRTWREWQRHGWMSTQSTYISAGPSTATSPPVTWLLRKSSANTSNVKTSNGIWTLWPGTCLNITHLWSHRQLPGERWVIKDPVKMCTCQDLAKCWIFITGRI